MDATCLKVGNRVTIDTFLYQGPATIDYISQKDLHIDHQFPIGVIVENLEDMEEGNHGQRYYRVGKNEILQYTGKSMSVHPEPYKAPPLSETKPPDIEPYELTLEDTEEVQLTLF